MINILSTQTADPTDLFIVIRKIQSGNTTSKSGLSFRMHD